LIGFPLVELMENRDYKARRTCSSTSATIFWRSSIFLARLAAGCREPGSVHIAISVATQLERIKAPEDKGITYLGPDRG
jgi:hypothetical protein